MLGALKRLAIGQPIPSYRAGHERLGLLTGLAVLSADALSSVAYASEEVLRVLMIGGANALAAGPWIAATIAALLTLVAISYRQTIAAYPSGGGAYVVARENLGGAAGLVAAAALLIDYVLTVAVSVAAGVLALASAAPAAGPWRVEIALAMVAALAIGNLRGLRESGRVFGIPVYGFVAIMLGLIGVGIGRWLTGSALPVVVEPLPTFGTGTLTTFALLTAFANGCTAMTGVEAVSNGVPAFREPSARYAARTLALMATLAVVMFIGISVLASHFGIVPSDQETVVSQLARGVFGGRTLPYYAVQAATMLILVLAANTAYADFPRLASVVARDRYLPRQFLNLGDKLAYSNGILVLSVAAGGLIAAFAGDPHALIPLYMIGVFLSFSLSQTGMVRRWRRQRGRGWRTSAIVNGVGAMATTVVLVIVAVTKAHDGAWIVMLLIPALVAMFNATRRHYDSVAAQLSLAGHAPDTAPHRHVVIVPIGGVHRAVVEALRYASALTDDVRAVYVNVNPDAMPAFKRDWPAWGRHVKLVVLQSPFRSMTEPLLDYIDRLQAEDPARYVTVIVPEFVVRRWWHHLLHNQSALALKAALLTRPNVASTSVPFHLAR